MVWLVDKRFEFTAHHNLQTCKRLLLDQRRPLPSPGISSSAIRRDVAVTVTDEGQGTLSFTINKAVGATIFVESRGTLRSGPDATTIVHGVGLTPRFPFMIFGLGLLIVVLNLLNGEDVPYLLEAFAVYSLVCASMLPVLMVYRNRLVALIADTLTDRGKVKKK